MDLSWAPEQLHPTLERLIRIIERDPSIDAAWLGGSLARGTADEWSDIDLHVLRGEAEVDVAWVAALLGAFDPLLVDAIPGVDGGFLVLTDECRHVDLIVHPREHFTQSDHPARVLHDPQQLIRTIEPQSENTSGEPYLPGAKPEVFLYFMTNLVTAAGRGEWLALASGTAMMRDRLLVDLMLAENGVHKVDGAKRLNRYLTREQRAALDALPAIGTDAKVLLECQRALAGDYLTRARRLHEQLGAPWPERLEKSVLRLWRDELGLKP